MKIDARMNLPRQSLAALFALALAFGCAADQSGDEPLSDASSADVRVDATPVDARVDARVDVTSVDARPDVVSRTDATLSDGATVVTGTCDPAMTPQRAECVCAPRTQAPCYPGAAAQVNVGVCRAGTARCNAVGEFGTWSACTGAVTPSPERCDGVDNNCNGTVDDGCACTPGMTRQCYGGPAGTMGVGPCRAGRPRGARAVNGAFGWWATSSRGSAAACWATSSLLASPVSIKALYNLLERLEALPKTDSIIPNAYWS